MFTITISADSAEALATQAAELAAQLGGATEDTPAEKPKATRGKAKPAAKAEEPEDAQVVEETKPEPKAKEPEYSLQDVRSEIAKLVALGAEGAKAAIQIVTDLDAKDEKGLPKADQIKPEKFGEAMRLVAEKIEALTPSGVL